MIYYKYILDISLLMFLVKIVYFQIHHISLQYSKQYSFYVIVY